MSNASTTPRVYLACLSSYNAGKLHGRWVDVEDLETLQAELHDILKTSPEPNVIRQDFRCKECGHVWHWTHSFDRPPGPDAVMVLNCPECNGNETCVAEGAPYGSSEEWAVHDHEGFGTVNIGEYPSLETLVELAEAINEHGDPFLAYLDHEGGLPQLERAKEKFQEAYRGEYDSLADYAEQFHEDTGAKIPEALQGFIDWERMGESWENGGEIYTVDADGGKIYIFDNTI